MRRRGGPDLELENTPALRGHQEQRDGEDLGGFEYDLDEDGDERWR